MVQGVNQHGLRLNEPVGAARAEGRGHGGVHYLFAGQTPYYWGKDNARVHCANIYTADCGQVTDNGNAISGKWS